MKTCEKTPFRYVAATFLALAVLGGTARADQAAQPAPTTAPTAMPAATPTAMPAAVPAADFGSPPSGEYPILYNDHTVYAKPDILVRNRVLAALVKGGQIYVPLRSMFEQMGATVSTSADGKTITATKPGASITVTVGKYSALINGESRPLDVPPMLYKGIVMAPVRVISESLGAYVQWVGDRRIVVVRYLPATPPTPAPVVTPPPTPTPAPVVIAPYGGFVQAAYSARRNYNELSAGQHCRGYLISGAYAFGNSPFAIKVDYRNDSYVTSDQVLDGFGNHYTSFVTVDGATALTNVFLAKQDNLDARLEYQIAAPRIYIGVGYISTTSNYGYPRLNGFGVGVEKLPDFNPGINFFASAFYYPSASGNYTIPDTTSPNFGKTYRQQFQITKYDIGANLVLAHFPVYLYGGFAADHWNTKQNAPIGQTHDGPYAGLGVKF